MFRNLLDSIHERLPFDRGHRNLFLFICGLAIVISSAFFYFAHSRATDQLVASSEFSIDSLKMPSPGTTESSGNVPQSDSFQGSVTVDVAGRVHKPGVYTLAAGSRAIDALHAAGDPLAHTDTSDINLAHVLSDGEQIIVGAGSTSRTTMKINLNTATLAELDSLPGVGPALAQRIINYRKSNGPFTSISEVQKVKGFGASKFDDIKTLIRV